MGLGRRAVRGSGDGGRDATGGEPASLRISIEPRPADGWDRLLFSSRTGSLHLYHSTAWAERLAEVAGFEPLYVTVLRDGDPQLLMLGLVGSQRRAGGWARGVVRRAREALVTGRAVRWYGQPMVLGDAGSESFAFLASSVAAYLKAHRLRMVGGEWPLEHESALPERWQRHRWATLKVDLTVDLDTLRSRLKPAARKEIRKAEASGVVVRRVEGADELERYVRTALGSSDRYGATTASVADYLVTWRRLRCDNLYFETFVASHDGQFLAGLSVWGTRDGICELGSFQSAYSFDRKLSGPDLIKWRAIEWAKSEGIRSFDLGGVNPAPATSKEENIRRFKEKWGGAYGEFVVVEG